MSQDLYKNIKDIAIEKVLNKYFSQNDPSHIAIRELFEIFLEWLMLYEREKIAFMIENILPLLVN